MGQDGARDAAGAAGRGEHSGRKGRMGRTTRFFRKKARDMGFRGVACFVMGIIMVLFLRWPIFGIILEGFGFINLFGNFFPIALAAMRTMPVVGDFLRLPGVSFVADKMAGGQQKRAQQWA